MQCLGRNGLAGFSWCGRRPRGHLPYTSVGVEHLIGLAYTLVVEKKKKKKKKKKC